MAAYLNIKLKNGVTYQIRENAPVIIKWSGKYKDRPGISTAIGWIKRGERPHTVLLVHSAFETHDQIEHDYPAKWTIFQSQILFIRELTGKLI